MGFVRMMAAAAAAAALVGADAAITSYRDGLPFADKGFGVRRSWVQSGRLSALVTDVADVCELHWIGRNSHEASCFYGNGEQSAWGRCMRPIVEVDGRPYRLEFNSTVHYPFGYRSECTVDGDVRLRHELVLDRNALFRRIIVLDNPAGKQVRGRVAQMSWGLRGDARFRMNADRTRLEASRRDADGTVTRMVVGCSTSPALFPTVDRPARPLAFGDDRHLFGRVDALAAAPGPVHVFYLAFDPAEDEDFSSARVDAVFAAFDRSSAGLASFATGNECFDAAMRGALDWVPAFEVDGAGAFRASSTYWVWGWDAMVHAGYLSMLGRAEEVRRMLTFFRRVADPCKGILHSYGTSFKFDAKGDSEDPGGSISMPPAIQLFYVVLLNDYYNATGDDGTLAECLPFARELVARAKASVLPGEHLVRKYAFFPDNPFSVEQLKDDVSLINNSVYYQGLAAFRELSGEEDPEVDAVARAFRETFWDPEEGYWADSFDPASGLRRRYWPLYGFFRVSPFADDIRACPDDRLADYMASRFVAGDRLPMFPIGSDGHLADGNQYGAYYPVTDRTYWNVMNRAGRVSELKRFRRIVADHWRRLTFPEGQSADVLNADVEDYTDNSGIKQFFALKSWLNDALEFNLGLRLGRNGVSFHAIGDGTPFAVDGLRLRGKRLSIRRTGSGATAKYRLNGAELARPFVAFDGLKDDNLLEIVCE